MKNYLSDFEGSEMVNFHGGQLAPKFDLPQMYIQGYTSCLTGWLLHVFKIIKKLQSLQGPKQSFKDFEISSNDKMKAEK